MGGSLNPHYDTYRLPGEVEGEVEGEEWRGTVMGYLTTVEQGGHTVFPRYVGWRDTCRVEDVMAGWEGDKLEDAMAGREGDKLEDVMAGREEEGTVSDPGWG